MQENEPAMPEAQGAPWVLRKWQAEALPLVVEAVKARKHPVVSAFMGSGKSVLIAELIRQTRPEQRSVVVAAPRANLVRQLAGTMRRGLGDAEVGEWYEAAKQADRPVVVTTYQSLPTLIEEWKRIGRVPRLLVCDEVHRTEAPSILASIEALQAMTPRGHLARIGLTATPFRSKHKERLSLWETVVYRYRYQDGLADNVIVPHRVECWERDADLNDQELDEICAHLLRKHGVFPTLASANDIDDAEEFATFLTAYDIPAASFHSRLSLAEQGRRIEALRSGALKVLVHVSMLAEGSDFPWLRGLLLRRHVQARVRFVQEVGRVLRWDAGKTCGVVLDPLDLMGMHGLSHEDGLGKALNGEDEEAEESEEVNKPKPGERKPVSAVYKRHLSRWLTRVLEVLEPHGLQLGSFVGVSGWRQQPASVAQVDAIEKMWKYLRYFPHEASRNRLNQWHREGKMRGICKGEASDLMTLLFWLGKISAPARKHAATTGDFQAARRLFRWPEGADLPDEIPTLDEADK